MENIYYNKDEKIKIDEDIPKEWINRLLNKEYELKDGSKCKIINLKIQIRIIENKSIKTPLIQVAFLKNDIWVGYKGWYTYYSLTNKDIYNLLLPSKKLTSAYRGCRYNDVKELYNLEFNLYREIYNKWEQMVDRVYLQEEKFKFYIDVSIDNYFLNFYNFLRWSLQKKNEISNFNLKELDLDKDLGCIINGKSKVYSKITCNYLPREINLIIRDIESDSYGIETRILKSGKETYCVRLRIGIKHNKLNLGTFHSLLEAKRIYANAKINHLEFVCDKYINSGMLTKNNKKLILDKFKERFIKDGVLNQMDNYKKILVIVESPAKAKTIEKILGPKYRITSSYGHVRGLVKSKIGVDIESGKYTPEYKIDKTKKEVVSKIVSEAKKSDLILLAGDNDREGEAISWHLNEILKKEVKVDRKRITFNAITPDEIKKAVANPREIDMNLVNAQQARRIIDRITGYKISPILWRAIAPGTSAGRVQSVALRLVCDLEKSIKAFKPETFWDIKGDFAKNIELLLYKINDKKIDKVFDPKVVEEVKKLQNALFEVSEARVNEKSVYASTPFKTSSLQQSAATYLGFSASRTMRVAQMLYEGVPIKGEHQGLITYMRTDSLRISNEAMSATRDFICSEFGNTYFSERHFKNKGGAQDAHECIRPTHINYTPEFMSVYLDPDQLKLYTLIWKRFVASQMSPMKYNQFELIAQKGTYEFRGTSNQIVFDGFYRLLPGDITNSEFPLLKKGDKIPLDKLKIKEDLTKPPSRLSEASLVKKLEAEEIGRPSTYATIIETLKKRTYVIPENKSFVPTDLGFEVADMLIENFPDLMNINFTKNMEKELDEIAEGKRDWVEIVDFFYKNLEKELINFKNKVVDLDQKLVESDVRCSCGAGMMVVKHGRFGKYLACRNPECKNKVSLKNIRITQEELDSGKVQVLEKINKRDMELKGIPTDLFKFGHRVFIKKGKFGPYLENEDYSIIPDNEKYRESLSKELIKLMKENKIPIENNILMLKSSIDEIENEENQILEAAGKVCPKCGSPLKICKGKFNSKFIGCSGYKSGCRYIAKIPK